MFPFLKMAIDGYGDRSPIRRKKADWILPAGHGLDPDHEVLLRVRQRLNAAKRLKDYTWHQFLGYYYNAADG